MSRTNKQTGSEDSADKRKESYSAELNARLAAYSDSLADIQKLCSNLLTADIPPAFIETIKGIQKMAEPITAVMNDTAGIKAADLFAGIGALQDLQDSPLVHFTQAMPYILEEMHRQDLKGSDYELNTLATAYFSISDHNKVPPDLQIDQKLIDVITAADQTQKTLSSFIEEQLKKTTYKGRKLKDIIKESTDADGNLLPNSSLIRLFESARQAAEMLPKVQTNRDGADSLEYGLDKVNQFMGWGDLTEADKNGQLTFAFEKNGSDIEANVIFAINFDELENNPAIKMSKDITPLDKRIYYAANALYQVDSKPFPLSQLYRTMGYSGRPNARDVERINNSLSKMAFTKIIITNEDIVNKGMKYPVFKYEGYLLPMERIDIVTNGRTTRDAIHILKEPPLISFAKAHKQITTIQRDLLETPISKTDANIQLEDYLTTRIARMKTGKVRKKILFATIFEATNQTEKKQKARTKDKVIKLLDHYMKKGWISGYSEQKDGVTIKL